MVGKSVGTKMKIMFTYMIEKSSPKEGSLNILKNKNFLEDLSKLMQKYR